MFLVANEIYLTLFYNNWLVIASQVGICTPWALRRPGEALPERVTFSGLRISKVVGTKFVI